MRQRIAIHRSAYHTCAAPTDNFATNLRYKPLRLLLTLILSTLLAISPVATYAFHRDAASDDLLARFDDGAARTDNRTAQKNGCLSLSEAIEQVRRETGGKILSAKTKMDGNREVHRIKVLTKDGKVRTIEIRGCRRDH